MFIVILFLSEGQASEAWEPLKSAMLLQVSGSAGQKKKYLYVAL
jgi:hypothetical protein